MMTSNVEKMIAVGLVWGATNALIRRGALLWDHQALKSCSSPTSPQKVQQKFLSSLRNWLSLLLFWQYSVPFMLNLSASATFFAMLSNAPISLCPCYQCNNICCYGCVRGVVRGKDPGWVCFAGYRFHCEWCLSLLYHINSDFF